MFTERATTTTTTTNDYNYTPRRGFRPSVRHHPGVGVFGARHAPSRPVWARAFHETPDSDMWERKHRTS